MKIINITKILSTKLLITKPKIQFKSSNLFIMLFIVIVLLLFLNIKTIIVINKKNSIVFFFKIL